MISITISAADYFHINRILDRAEARGLIGDDDGRLLARMDLCAIHTNGCPLDFKRFAGADDFTFMHDFCGIARHIDRKTGKLTRCFLPRFAQKRGGLCDE